MSGIAFIFPGQGSQSLRMLHDLAQGFPVVLDVFDKVSAQVGYDVWDLVQNGPETKLNQTEHTQVAMLTADVAVYEIIKRQGLTAPTYMAGHSLGEYAALVCANALTLADGALLVARRGQLMQETIPLGQGAMAAVVGLSNDQVEVLCQEASDASELVTPANYNAIGQVVVAGHVGAVKKLLTLAEQAGARLAVLIPVSVPCHCPLLQQTAQQFKEVLHNTLFTTPQVSVLSNVDMSVYQSPETMRTLLKEQLYKPVRWVETIQKMKQNGVETIIECGPGKVLSGLVKRIDKSIQVQSVYDRASLDTALSILQR